MNELLEITPTNQMIKKDSEPPPIIRQPIFARSDRVYELRAAEVASKIDAVNIGYPAVNPLDELNQMTL